jgi:iron complex transport system substrate-binding protein
VAFVESLRADPAHRRKPTPKEAKETVYAGGNGYRGAHGIESTEQHDIPFEPNAMQKKADEIYAYLVGKPV